jgi:hypothetical protein
VGTASQVLGSTGGIMGQVFADTKPHGFAIENSAGPSTIE